MALTGSGAISLNVMHIEAGGSSGTTCTINDSDIRGLISKGSGATMSFNEWYGASAYTAPTATGGTITTVSGYKYHAFNSSGNFNVSNHGDNNGSQYEYVVIAGGGGAAGSIAGGGGAGGMLSGTGVSLSLNTYN